MLALGAGDRWNLNPHPSLYAEDLKSKAMPDNTPGERLAASLGLAFKEQAVLNTSGRSQEACKSSEGDGDDNEGGGGDDDEGEGAGHSGDNGDGVVVITVMMVMMVTMMAMVEIMVVVGMVMMRDTDGSSLTL